MRARVKEPPPSLVPAAQYVRVSDEGQQYSIDNQKAAIQEYADRHGFVVVKTYADAGKSGIYARNRAGLRELLKDVVSGDADYKVILVYDVSRWGRFPNSDEAAHYEFLCSSTGIPLHYCAEPFKNDGTLSSSLFKALKRSMAAEFSRELGEKVFRGKARIAQLGFWVGGPPGSGYRRLMVSADGSRKQEMKLGEHKSLTTDRVILVPGPLEEIEGIKEMFAMAIKRKGCRAIANELNRRGFTNAGSLWTNQTVFNAVTNPKYTGCNIWNRWSQKFRGRRIPVKSEQWIKKPGAFEAIIDQKTFDLAQARLPKIADYRWTNEKILKRVRCLLKAKGRLSDSLFLKARNMPVSHTLRMHFGSVRRVYELVGYRLDERDALRDARLVCSSKLRRRLLGKIRDMFPEHVQITHLPEGSRSILRIDNTFMVSVMLCGIKRRKGRRYWRVEPIPLESDYITLFCKLNLARNRVLSYHLFPKMNKSRRSYDNDPWLNNTPQLHDLAEFYPAVRRLWEERST